MPKLEKSKGKGWYGESERHSLAARGIETVERVPKEARITVTQYSRGRKTKYLRININKLTKDERKKVIKLLKEEGIKQGGVTVEEFQVMGSTLWLNVFGPNRKEVTKAVVKKATGKPMQLMRTEFEILAWREKHKKLQLKISSLESKMLSDKPKRSMSAYRKRQNKRKEQIDKLRIRLRDLDKEFVGD